MSDTIPTLAVPAPLYDEALAFCNARLAEQGKPAIETLPAGEPGMTRSCPCAHASGVRVGMTKWGRDDAPCLLSDGHPTGFVEFFDNRAKPGVETLPLRDATPPVPS